MISFLLLQSTAWILLLLPVASAQQHRPPIRDRYRSNTGLIIGVSIGTITLLFLASVLYARIVSRRREASRGGTRADEEFTITPLAALSPTLVVAPPPYENPPSFEDATKRAQTASVSSGSRPREGQDGRDGVAGRENPDEVRR